MERSQQTEQGQETANHCYWHPDAETGLSCSQCSKSMCTRCMVQAPVGIRCRECGKAAPMPTFDVQRSYYARAVAVGLGVAFAGGILWAVANAIFGAIPFLPSLIGIGIGYGAGELISLSVNRKRGTGLAWIAACSVVGAFLIRAIAGPFGFGMFGLLFIAMGVFIAAKRVR